MTELKIQFVLLLLIKKKRKENILKKKNSRSFLMQFDCPSNGQLIRKRKKNGEEGMLINSGHKILHLALEKVFHFPLFVLTVVRHSFIWHHETSHRKQ